MTRFIDYITTDKTMKNRLLLAHNGGRYVLLNVSTYVVWGRYSRPTKGENGPINWNKSSLNCRFDHHLIFTPLIRRKIFPKLIMRGTTIMSATFNPPTWEKKNRLTLRDTYLVIPYALEEFRKSFDLKVDSKGDFPHLLWVAKKREKKITNICRTEPKNFGKIFKGLPHRRFVLFGAV